MTKFTPQEHDIFNRLQAAMVDPFVERTMMEARRCEDVVNELNATPEDRQQFIDGLDKDWIFRREAMVVTGDVWIVASPDSREPFKISATNLSVISDGFIFDPDRLEIEGERMDGLQRISYALIIDTGRPDGVLSYGALHFDDVRHIEYPFASPELSERRFRYHYERQADEIDAAYRSAADDGEVIALLSDFSLDVNTADPSDIQGVADGQAYLNRRGRLDTTVPYIMTIQGFIAVLDTTQTPVSAHKVSVNAQSTTVTQPVTRLATLNEVRLMPADWSADLSQGTHRYVPYVDCIADSRDKSVPRQNLLVPFSSIVRAENLRSLL